MDLLSSKIKPMYFQYLAAASGSALVASLARGAVVSGACILLLPMIAGADSLWYAMLATEVLVAAYGVYHMVKITRKL